MAIANTNPRIGTLNNLATGGTYDILMITYPDGFPEGEIRFDFDTTPRKVTGVQKAAQLFVKLLMSTKGSDAVYPNRGTLFSAYTVNANIVANDHVLQSNLVTAVDDAFRQARLALSSDPDPSSRLAQVKIAGFDSKEDAITMYVQVTTASGISAQVAIPFPQLGLV
jgi:hypothetical protein